MSTPRPSVRSGTRTTPPPRPVSAPTRPAAAAPEKRSAVNPRTFIGRSSVRVREDRGKLLDDLRARVLVVRRRVEAREVERRVEGEVALPEDLPRDLLVEEEVAEAVHAHGHGDRLRPVEKLRDAGAQRRAFLRRAGGEVQQPSVRDRLLHLREALEVRPALHVFAALAEASPER